MPIRGVTSIKLSEITYSFDWSTIKNSELELVKSKESWSLLIKNPCVTLAGPLHRFLISLLFKFLL